MKKIAAIDIGLKRIGVALCLSSSIVAPQEAILRKNRDQAAHDVDTFLQEWGIELLVVGLPKNGSSSEEME
ncbi:MAG: Holliday junction resolvase RuvX, partial [Campylobacteraceae bacterium]|nr:Holliday junction resolvase RuvX [Campylobacteraceae bacterium]